MNCTVKSFHTWSSFIWMLKINIHARLATHMFSCQRSSPQAKFMTNKKARRTHTEWRQRAIEGEGERLRLTGVHLESSLFSHDVKWLLTCVPFSFARQKQARLRTSEFVSMLLYALLSFIQDTSLDFECPKLLPAATMLFAGRSNMGAKITFLLFKGM